MDKHIDEYLAGLLPELAGRGIRVSAMREIAYGVQLRLECEGDSATLNVYYSEKRGLSKVLGASSGSQLKPVLEELCRVEKTPQAEFHSWDIWIGSDESGKGDYFGALVVAAFAMDRQYEGELRELGVMDSKRLKDPQIKTIAMQLYARFNSRIACIVIKPPKYNEIIADMKGNRQNLNDLLAWQHSTAILELLKQNPDAQGVLVDQFSTQKKVRKLLKNREIAIPVEERTGAEADVAVAAASIIARYQLIQNREAMNRFYGINFPFGAGNNVLKPAQAFVEKYGLKRLAEVAKLHFVTSIKVQQKEIDIHEK